MNQHPGHVSMVILVFISVSVPLVGNILDLVRCNTYIRYSAGIVDEFQYVAISNSLYWIAWDCVFICLLVLFMVIQDHGQYILIILAYNKTTKKKDKKMQM